jgi:hypothetical protein
MLSLWGETANRAMGIFDPPDRRFLHHDEAGAPMLNRRLWSRFRFRPRHGPAETAIGGADGVPLMQRAMRRSLPMATAAKPTTHITLRPRASAPDDSSRSLGCTVDNLTDSGHRQVSNRHESCMTPRWSHHAVPHHPAPHDLSLPASRRLRRTPDDAPSTQLPRSKSGPSGPKD